MQVIVGLDVPQVLESIQEVIKDEGGTSAVTTEVSPEAQAAAFIADSLGTEENIEDISADSKQMTFTVKDPAAVDNEETFKSLGLSIKAISIQGNQVKIEIDNALKIAGQI
jgi:PTS system arbutin-like IIC component